jgi:hypothetical protein
MRPAILSAKQHAMGTSKITRRATSREWKALRRRSTATQDCEPTLTPSGSLPFQTMSHRRIILLGVVFTGMFSLVASPSLAQQNGGTQHSYPKEIRGYKVEAARVEPRKQKDGGAAGSTQHGDGDEFDDLIQFGDPQLVRVTPLGITIDLPIKLSPVNHGGRVDFLAFEDMVVNGTPVSVEDYNHPFDLPSAHALVLPGPLRVYISTPMAVLGAIGEWGKEKETWPITGRVFVFGHFKKYLMKFKRVVPVELDLSIPNPLKET